MSVWLISVMAVFIFIIIPAHNQTTGDDFASFDEAENFLIEYLKC